MATTILTVGDTIELPNGVRFEITSNSCITYLSGSGYLSIEDQEGDEIVMVDTDDLEIIQDEPEEEFYSSDDEKLAEAIRQKTTENKIAEVAKLGNDLQKLQLAITLNK